MALPGAPRTRQHPKEVRLVPSRGWASPGSRRGEVWGAGGIVLSADEGTTYLAELSLGRAAGQGALGMAGGLEERACLGNLSSSVWLESEDRGRWRRVRLEG